MQVQKHICRSASSLYSAGMASNYDVRLIAIGALQALAIG